MDIVCSRAPGKIILFGEHFVVGGYPAIGVAVSLYAKTCVKRGDLRIYSKQLGLIDASSMEAKPFLRVIREVSRRFKCGEEFTVYVDSEIPPGAGMGSSAALNVSLANSLLEACRASFTRDDVNSIAYLGEVEVHGKPSGVDNALSTYGGFMYYKQGLFRRLDVQIPENVELIVADTGVKRSTGVVVREVIERRARLGVIGDTIYQLAGLIVEEALRALESRDIVKLGELMSVNQGLLFSMGASSWVNDYLVHRMINLGAYGAKLSGAGRGGVVIGLAPAAVSEVIASRLTGEGFKVYRVKPDYSGVVLVDEVNVEPG
ncbi:MAG: mevalonate kinase [Desulfurococcus sp.]|nr:mevalonate kinase [Desulfurococcus sp.]